MNCLYDANEAKLWLDSYIQKSLQEEPTANTRYIDLLEVGKCKVVEYGEPPCVRLIQEVADSTEEVMVRVPGILCSKTLPPVHGLRSTKPEHVRYLRQFARLTGLGSDVFAEHKSVFKRVYDAFAAAPPVDNAFNFDFGLYEKHDCIDMHARYLTERRFVPSQPHIPFTPDVDPNHALDLARDTEFIRVEDNVVQYTKRISYEDGSHSYEPLDPEEFKEGDIVEAVGAFVAFPTGREGQFKMVFCLRALVMLTSSFREKSRKARSEMLARVDPTEGRKKKRSKPPTAEALKRSFIQYGRRSEAGRGGDKSAMVD
ncbi:hypothetical protein DFP72DRAFT_31314 [Ephemerocybe angulata]|uniref:Uncharacterized protein n=1 Tax=Ephemerocybe angulata TaxID=980116 RepID=A0A8H6H886_9AGAR|nr:hypothetical protein DFP72DRAFT_945929 [Tulosesus angulatus]KAF6761077.1 hypothetical protein DFP72DRAFT_31314 [Tulosesus angulatus]